MKNKKTMNYAEILREWKDKCCNEKYKFDLIYGGYIVDRQKTGGKITEKSLVHYVLYKSLIVNSGDREKLVDIIQENRKLKAENRLKLFIVEWPVISKPHLRRNTTRAKLIVAKNEQDAISYSMEEYWIDDECFPDNPDPAVFTVKFIGFPSKEYSKGNVILTSRVALS
jgi:hypothetical protein